MLHYRRALTGTTFFFTVVTHRRRPMLCDDAVRNALHDAITQVRRRLPFDTDSMVLMPAPSGSAAPGNTGSGMSTIWNGMWITSTSTR